VGEGGKGLEERMFFRELLSQRSWKRKRKRKGRVAMGRTNSAGRGETEGRMHKKGLPASPLSSTWVSRKEGGTSNFQKGHKKLMMGKPVGGNWD